MESLGAVGSIASVIGLGLSVWLLVAGKRISDRLLEQRRAITFTNRLPVAVRKLKRINKELLNFGPSRQVELVGQALGIIDELNTYVPSELKDKLETLKQSFRREHNDLKEMTTRYRQITYLEEHLETIKSIGNPQ